MNTTSTTRKLTRFQYAATLLGALAVVGLAPATAHATDNDPTGGTGGGCHYTDVDGYDVPIDDGQDVFVDGKIVSCRGGSIVITTAPLRGVGSVRPPLGGANQPVLTQAPQKLPVANRNVTASKAP